MSPKRVLIGVAIFASTLPAAAQSESTSTWSLW
jgi:hypothetical protein